MKTKKISPIVLLFSILLSFAIIIGNKIVFCGKVYENNYLKNDYSLLDLFLFLLIIVISYISIFFVKKLYLNFYDKLLSYKAKSKFNFCFFAIVLFSFVYFIYFLTFYPGGIYTDTHTSYFMMKGIVTFTSHHPVLYTLFTYILTLFRPFEIAVVIFALLQLLFMISTLIYFIYWLLNKGLNKYLVLSIIFFLAIFKLYPLYSISLWKDTPFSLALFLYTLTFIDLIIECFSKQVKTSTIVKLNIFSILVIFLRNNRYFYNIH